MESEYKDINVLLVDNGSENADYNNLTDAFTNNPKVRLLRIDKNCGYVGGVNYGLKQALLAEPDYFLIMNNDTIIDRYAIGCLVEAAERYNDKAIVSGKVYYYDHPDILQHTGVIFKDKRYLTTTYPGKGERDTGQFDDEAERDSLDDVFWLLPLGLVKEIGFYSDYFFLYAEQGDYAQRARRQGYKLIFTPGAKLWHKVGMTTGEGKRISPAICFWRGQGRFVFQYRNLKRKYFINMMLVSFMKMLAQSILKEGDAGRCSRAQLRGYFWGFRWMFNKRPNNGLNPYLNKS